MITVICSECGGTGIIEYFSTIGYWAWCICPECAGKGTVQELSFEERKERELNGQV